MTKGILLICQHLSSFDIFVHQTKIMHENYPFNYKLLNTNKSVLSFWLKLFPLRNLFHSIYGGIFRRRWNPKKNCCRNQNKKQKGFAGSTRLEFLALHMGKQSFLLEIRHNNLSNWNKPRKQKTETITWLIETNPGNKNPITWNKPSKKTNAFQIHLLKGSIYVTPKKDYTNGEHLLLSYIWIFGRKFSVRRCWPGKKVFPSF